MGRHNNVPSVLYFLREQFARFLFFLSSHCLCLSVSSGCWKGDKIHPHKRFYKRLTTVIGPIYDENKINLSTLSLSDFRADFCAFITSVHHRAAGELLQYMCDNPTLDVDSCPVEICLNE